MINFDINPLKKWHDFTVSGTKVKQPIKIMTTFSKSSAKKVRDYLLK